MSMIKYNKSSPAMEYLLGELKSNPRLSFEELRERAQLNSMHVSRINYGRAKAMLGLSEATEEDASFPADGEWRDQPEPTPEEPVVENDPPSRASLPTSNGRKGRPLGAPMSFVLEQLQMNPEASNKDILARAQLEKIEVTPNTLSLARKRLGLGRSRKPTAKSAPRVESNAEPAPTLPEPAPRASVSKPSAPRSTTTSRLDQLEQLLAALREDQEEGQRLEQAIRKAIEVLQGALEG